MTVARPATIHLPTLADEVFGELTALVRAHPTGVTVSTVAKKFSADAASARRALRQLNTEGRAKLMRRMDSRQEFLVPLRYRAAPGLRICANCGIAFQLRPMARYATGTSHDNRKCCTRTCSISWSWRRPGVADRRKAGIRAERATPAARARAANFNKKRWAKPGERERLSESNRRRWADPAIKAEWSRAIARVQRSPEMRRLYSELRKQWWKDPAMREKMIASAKRVKNTPEFKAYFSELCRKRWRDPVWRKKWLAAARKNAAKAGHVSAEIRRKKKQLHEQRTA